MELTSLKELYEALEVLKKLDLPISAEIKKSITELEKQYIEENVIPVLKSEMTPFLSSIRNDFKLHLNYSPEMGINCVFHHENREEPSREKGVTKYSFDGGNPMKKRRFVLAVVKQYVENHPNVTLAELEHRFPTKLSNSTLNGVVRKYEDVIHRAELQPDLRKRFFLDANDIITLADGTKVVVYNQWGSMFDNFLAVARELHTVECFES